LKIFSQKYEVRILIFFKTFKDGIWYYIARLAKIVSVTLGATLKISCLIYHLLSGIGI